MRRGESGFSLSNDLDYLSKNLFYTPPPNTKTLSSYAYSASRAGELLKETLLNITENMKCTNPYFTLIQPERAIDKITKLLKSLQHLLYEKNKRYGDSALNPLNIFSTSDPVEGICLRLDDKLARIKNSTALRKNDLADILGYITLLCVAKGYDNFDDLID